MSVRLRTWTNQHGMARSAWVVDWSDEQGKRRTQTFKREQDAIAYQAVILSAEKDGTWVIAAHLIGKLGRKGAELVGRALATALGKNLEPFS